MRSVVAAMTSLQYGGASAIDAAAGVFRRLFLAAAAAAGWLVLQQASVPALGRSPSPAATDAADERWRVLMRDGSRDRLGVSGPCLSVYVCASAGLEGHVWATDARGSVAVRVIRRDVRRALINGSRSSRRGDGPSQRRGEDLHVALATPRLTGRCAFSSCSLQ